MRTLTLPWGTWTLRRQILFHLPLLVLPVVVLPIGIMQGWLPPGDANPIPWLLAILLVSVGLPFFVLSSTAPLLQRWFVATGHPSGKDPYFLYAASNLGSMLALFSYPSLIEPYLPLQPRLLSSQSWLWTIGYGLAALLLGGCGLVVLRSLGQQAKTPEAGDSADAEVGPPRQAGRRSAG